jgi:hypothetical protein
LTRVIRELDPRIQAECCKIFFDRRGKSELPRPSRNAERAAVKQSGLWMSFLGTLYLDARIKSAHDAAEDDSYASVNGGGKLTGRECIQSWALTRNYDDGIR